MDNNLNFKVTNDDIQTDNVVGEVVIASEENNNLTAHADSNSHDHSHHRSSNHSRSHHHRRHGKRSKKKKLSIGSKVGWTIAITFCVLFFAFVIGLQFIDLGKDANSNQQSNGKKSEILEVEVINKEGMLVKDAVNQYVAVDMLNSENSEIIPSSFSDGSGRFDKQIPVSLKLSVKGVTALSYKIEYGINDTFKNAEIRYLDGSVDTFEFKHLYTNTTYYYRVTVYTDTGTDSVEGSFQTADTPRFLSIGGLSRVRDIGNWITDSGKRIKQGLLIRGTEMDGDVEPSYSLTNSGLIDMIEVLGIKTDIDLRAETLTSQNALGMQIEHRYYVMVQYSGIFTNEGKVKIREVFADLADPNNYPVYLHCTYGCDRTGTVCFLLEAVLGVSKEDCFTDYGLSDMKVENLYGIEEGLKSYNGDTLKEQVESYLLSCGVTKAQIESIRKIFLED